MPTYSESRLLRCMRLLAQKTISISWLNYFDDAVICKVTKLPQAVFHVKSKPGTHSSTSALLSKTARKTASYKLTF
jgi:hypothetical protein